VGTLCVDDEAEIFLYIAILWVGGGELFKERHSLYELALFVELKRASTFWIILCSCCYYGCEKQEDEN
jgi:hypothetical protein